MLELIRNLMPSRRSEDGASAVEYGLLVAGIAALIVVIVFAFGGVISGVFSSTCNTIATHQSSASAAASTSATCS